MTCKPANCPALVTLVRLVSAACNTDRPPCTARIPKLKLTAKYPAMMGEPSRSPCKNSFFIFLHLCFPVLL